MAWLNTTTVPGISPKASGVNMSVGRSSFDVRSCRRYVQAGMAMWLGLHSKKAVWDSALPRDVHAIAYVSHWAWRTATPTPLAAHAVRGRWPGEEEKAEHRTSEVEYGVVSAISRVSTVAARLLYSVTALASTRVDASE